MTAGLSTMSFGSPSAILRPKCSTTSRSEIPMIAFMTCSITKSVTPLRLIETISSIAFSISDWLRPAMTSSRKRSWGSMASALASSRRLRSRIVSSVAVRSRMSARPTPLEDLVGLVPRLGRAAPASARAEHRARRDVLAHGELPERLDDLERPRHAEASDAVARRLRDVLPVEDDRARRRLVEAGHAVHERGLARPVRADDAEDLALSDREVDAVHGGEAAELLRDPASLEDGMARDSRHVSLRRALITSPGGRARSRGDPTIGTDALRAGACGRGPS